MGKNTGENIHRYTFKNKQTKKNALRRKDKNIFTE